MATILLRDINPIVFLHNVGAGVTDPDQALEVGGIIHISEEQGSTPSAPSNGDGGLLYTKADGKLYWRSNDVSESDLTAAGEIGTGTANKVAIWSDEDTIFADSGLHWDSTNNRLGIGQPSPSSPISVVNADNQLADFQSTDTDAYLRIRDSNDSLYIGSDAGIGTFGGTTGAHANNLSIDLANGRVGIGTGATSPTCLLQMKKADSSVVFNIHADTDSSAVPAIELQRGANDTWGADNYTDYRIKDTGGNLVIENASGGNAAVERLQILDAGGVKINGAYTLPTAVTSTNDYVLTAQTNGTTAWAAAGGSTAGISSSADATAITITSAERVGVGTGGATAPDSLFHVDDASDTFDQGGMKVRIHSEVAASDKYAGIGFGVDTGGRLMKSAIVHKRTGGNGQGELLFCVDSSTDGNDVSTADEVMKLTKDGHVVLNTSKLPTSEPAVVGALWVDSGTIKIKE